ncbi:MAG: hypothetical protein V1672_03705 [Candidatus Diapherotrites archaeon]
MTYKKFENTLGNEGQGALEYLMTHAWAMVALAVVIGVIIFVFGNISGSTSCTSDDTKIIYYDHAVSETGELTLILQNATGRSINEASTVFSGDFAGIGSVSTIPVPEGELFTISGNTDLGDIREYKGRIELSYKTTTGIQHTVKITCSGVKASS